VQRGPGAYRLESAGLGCLSAKVAGMFKQRVKALLRLGLRPLLGWADRRVDHRVAQADGGLRDSVQSLAHRVGVVERQLRDADELFVQYRHVVPALLDAVSSQHSAARELKRQEAAVWQALEEAGRRLAQMEARVEHGRRELLFELRYGGHKRGVTDPAVEPKILNQAKIDEMGGELRLNLGSGAFALDGFLNVDVREIAGVVDVVADLGHLPFGPDSVAEIFSSHVLEHFPEEELVRRLIPYWVSLLRPGGVFRAVVPDAETMLQEWAAGRMSFDDLRLVTFGDQEYDGDFHFTMFTPASLTAHLAQAGLEDIELIACGRPNGKCYEMELVGRRPR
jgi:SAM-dependent methyltransferase